MRDGRERQIEDLRIELDRLERDEVDLDGVNARPSQCYRFETDPPHFMYNTNCPESLKEKLSALFKKYFPGDESRTYQP